jgi:hypothetical protein
MPCNSDYLRQTPEEAALQETAQLCQFVASEIGLRLPPTIEKQASEYYAKDKGQVEWLCAFLQALKANDEAKFDAVVYDGRKAISRRLADWWDRHVAADEARERQEAAEARHAQLRKQILAKLSEEEREYLTRYI